MKVKLPALSVNYDKQTNQPTDQQTDATDGQTGSKEVNGNQKKQILTPT